MGLRFAHTFVVVAAVLAFTQSVATRQLAPVNDSDAYAIYAILLTGWATHSKDVLLLQQETAPPMDFCERHHVGAEWQETRKNFRQANIRNYLLEPVLPVTFRYQLIPRADIEGDDARLALKYPGLWQRRPESMEYASVSAVGFNQAKTKALVSVRLRSSGGVYAMELREGKWEHGPALGCRWVA